MHGYRGLSFRILAERLETTRANLHYHFGNKLSLVEEVVDAYATGTAKRFRTTWTDRETSFDAKVLETYAFNRERFLRFNDGEVYKGHWSLITRMRNDIDVLSPKAIERLHAYTRETIEVVHQGIEMSMERGDLVAHTPVEDIALQLNGIFNSAGSITQEAGNISGLEKLYRAFLTTVQAAYGIK